MKCGILWLRKWRKRYISGKGRNMMRCLTITQLFMTYWLLGGQKGIIHCIVWLTHSIQGNNLHNTCTIQIVFTLQFFTYSCSKIVKYNVEIVDTTVGNGFRKLMALYHPTRTKKYPKWGWLASKSFFTYQKNWLK